MQQKASLLPAPRSDLSLLTNAQSDSTLRTIPFRSPRRDLGQADALQMEPLLLALLTY